VVAGACLWSDETCRLLGYEPGVVVPTFDVCVERVHPDDRDRLRSSYIERMRAGIGWELTDRIVTVDGTVRQIRGVTEYDHDVAGEIVRAVGVIQDVTPADVATGHSAALPALLAWSTLVQVID